MSLRQEIFNAIEEKKSTEQFYIRNPACGSFKVRGDETRPLTGEAAEKAARQVLIGDVVRAETNTKALAAAADAEVKYEGPYARIMSEQAPADAKAPNGK